MTRWIVVLAFVAGCGASGARTGDVTDVPVASSGPPAPPPRVDTEASKAIAIDPRNVTVALSTEALRNHPVGKHLGPLVAQMPQWHDAVQGILSDPLKDLDWIYFAGPSFQHASKGALLLKHTLGDQAIEDRIDALAKRSPSSAPYDLGLADAKGTLAGDRVIVRAHPSVVAMVPPDFAKPTAALLVRAKIIAPLTPPTALVATVKDPHRAVPNVPACIKDAHVTIVAKDDGGADITADGTCPDAAQAGAAADELRAFVQRNNGMIARMLTQNILGGVRIQSNDTHVELHLSASQSQLEATLRIVASMLGVDLRGGAH